MDKKLPTILVIEDEQSLLYAIEKKLSLSKMSPVICSSAQEAIKYLQQAPELPDLIWLDYYLPDMDGLEFMHELKTNKKWQEIPVFVVSNSASATRVHSMLALGANQYFLKAEKHLEEIIDEIRKFLNV